MKRLALALLVGSALLLAGCVLPAAAPAPEIPTTTTAPPKPVVTKGFDACAAPTSATMAKWRSSSPYSSVGVYIGGANRGCSQPNLTSSGRAP